LLRQVLTDPRFHVVHFDLRIAGFADVTSLYMSLAAQFEHFFESIANQLEGYEEMKKHALMFKHAWMDWEKRLQKPENQLKVPLPCGPVSVAVSWEEQWNSVQGLRLMVGFCCGCSWINGEIPGTILTSSSRSNPSRRTRSF
jgi:hypothetical protein